MQNSTLKSPKFLISLFLIAIFTLTLVLPVSANTILQDKQKKKETTTEKQIQTSKKETQVNKSEKEKFICVVTGEEADPELKMEYKGKTYYFCCKRCMKKFKDNPEKYIKSNI